MYCIGLLFLALSSSLYCSNSLLILEYMMETLAIAQKSSQTELVRDDVTLSQLSALWNKAYEELSEYIKETDTEILAFTRENFDKIQDRALATIRSMRTDAEKVIGPISTLLNESHAQSYQTWQSGAERFFVMFVDLIDNWAQVRWKRSKDWGNFNDLLSNINEFLRATENIDRVLKQKADKNSEYSIMLDNAMTDRIIDKLKVTLNSFFNNICTIMTSFTQYNQLKQVPYPTLLKIKYLAQNLDTYYESKSFEQSFKDTQRKFLILCVKLSWNAAIGGEKEEASRAKYERELRSDLTTRDTRAMNNKLSALINMYNSAASRFYDNLKPFATMLEKNDASFAQGLDSIFDVTLKLCEEVFQQQQKLFNLDDIVEFDSTISSFIDTFEETLKREHLFPGFFRWFYEVPQPIIQNINKKVEKLKEDNELREKQDKIHEIGQQLIDELKGIKDYTGWKYSFLKSKSQIIDNLYVESWDELVKTAPDIAQKLQTELTNMWNRVVASLWNTAWLEEPSLEKYAAIIKARETTWREAVLRLNALVDYFKRAYESMEQGWDTFISFMVDDADKKLLEGKFSEQMNKMLDEIKSLFEKVKSKVLAEQDAVWPDIVNSHIVNTCEKINKFLTLLRKGVVGSGIASLIDYVEAGQKLMVDHFEQLKRKYEQGEERRRHADSEAKTGQNRQEHDDKEKQGHDEEEKEFPGITELKRELSKNIRSLVQSYRQSKSIDNDMRNMATTLNKFKVEHPLFLDEVYRFSVFSPDEYKIMSKALRLILSTHIYKSLERDLLSQLSAVQRNQLKTKWHPDKVGMVVKLFPIEEYNDIYSIFAQVWSDINPSKRELTPTEE